MADFLIHATISNLIVSAVLAGYGKVSKEDAEKRLIEMRKYMFRQDESADRDDREMEAKKRKYMEAARKIEAAVKDGKVSKEDAEKRLIEIRKYMFKQDESADRDDREMEAKKRRYMEAARKIEAAVKDGKVSKEDAEKRHNDLRKEMSKLDESKVRGMEAKRRRYLEMAREIESAVRKGKASKEDAEKRLNGLRKEMFKQDDSKDRDWLKPGI